MIKFAAAILALYASTVFAVLEVTILKKDEDAFPIVIAPFSVKGDAKQGEVIAHVMRDNLNRSGEFNASSADYVVTSQIDFDKWQAEKTEAIVIGKLEQVSKKIFNVEIELIDIYSRKTLYAKKFAVHNSGIRRITH